MPAQIRPTRLEVSDRFPMLGFTIRAEGPPQRAEVVLGSEPGLFGAEGKARRTAANFYSTRGAGPLQVARGEAVFIVPPEVLARFVGNEKLYFGLATAREGDGGAMQVAVKPTAASPYISLKGLTGRSMHRVRVLPSRQQRAAGYSNGGQAVLEWAGDEATPGMEPARSNGGGAASLQPSGAAKPNGSTATAPEAAPYDDGFGPMPAKSATDATSPTAAPAAQALGGRRGRLGSAMAAGDIAASGGPLPLTSPPAPRARAMGGGADAAIAIGGFLVESVRDSSGDVTWELDQFAQRKHPNDVAPANPAPYKDAATIRLDSWPVSGGVIDDISAWFSVDWQYNGTSLGNIRIGNIGTNDAIGWGLHVRAQIMDDNILYQPGPCAALRVRFHYRFTRSIGSDVLAMAELHLYGDGTYEQSSQWLQSSALALSQPYAQQRAQPRTQPQRRTQPNKLAQAMVVGLEDRQKARKYAKDYTDIFQWQPPKEVVTELTQRGFTVQTLDAAVGDLNLDFYKVLIRRFPPGLDANKLLQTFIRDIDSFINSTYCSFTPFEQVDEQRLASSNPRGTVFFLDMLGPDNAAIAITEVNPQYYVVTTIHTERTGDHPVSGHRQFGYFTSNAGTTFYTRGADRATLGFPGTEHAIFKGGELIWESFQNKLANFINNTGGSAEIIDPFSERFDAQAVREEFGHYDVFSMGLGAGRTMGTGPFTTNWDEVELIPQPTKFSCWAAAGAMLAGWRDRVSLNPDTVAQICGRSTASGLLTDDNAKFAAEMGFNTAPAVCYTDDGFRTLLENNGPLWVSEGVPPNLHAIVVTGMYSDGNNTYVRIADPWDRVVGTPGKPGAYAPTHATGSRYILTWNDFTQQYEAAMTGDPPNRQILHSGNPNGLSPNTGQTTPPPGYAQAYVPRLHTTGRTQAAGDAAASGDALPLSEPPPPRARAMDGGVSAAIAIGGFLLTSIRDSQGDVTWELDQFAQRKHPNDVAPANPAAYKDAPTIRLDSWPVSGGVIDDISAWFSVDWQYNGTSLGNIRISNIGTNDAVGWGLNVRAQIMDDNILYEPGPCAALRVRFHYRFTRSIGSDVLAMTELHLYGDGTYEQNSQWLQSSALALNEQRAQLPRKQNKTGRLARGQAAGDIAASGDALPLSEPPAPRARAMDGGASAAIAIGGFLLTSIRDSQGDVTWELDQFAQRKHPNDVAPASPAPYKDAPTIRLDSWPVSGGMIDDISAWFSVDWQYNGTSLGNIRISNIGTNDAVGWGLNVRAQIMDDNILYQPGPCAALRVRFHYRFTRSIGSDVLAMTELHLYGDGTYEQSSQWLQSSTLAFNQPQRATGRTFDAGAVVSAIGIVVGAVTSSSGDVSWELDAFNAIKHPNDVAPPNPKPFRNAPPIKIEDWTLGWLDEIGADFNVNWQYNGASIGNISIVNTYVNDAIGVGLKVKATIAHDNVVYDNRTRMFHVLPDGSSIQLLTADGGIATPDINRQPCASMNIHFDFTWNQTIGPAHKAAIDVYLFGDGTYARYGRWIQHSFL